MSIDSTVGVVEGERRQRKGVMNERVLWQRIRVLMSPGYQRGQLGEMIEQDND